MVDVSLSREDRRSPIDVRIHPSSSFVMIAVDDVGFEIARNFEHCQRAFSPSSTLLYKAASPPENGRKSYATQFTLMYNVYSLCLRSFSAHHSS